MKLKNSSDILIHTFLLICIAVLVCSFLFLLNEIRKIKENKTIITKETVVQQIDSKEVIVKTPIPAPTLTSFALPTKKISYLNLNGSFTTTNTDWTDIGGTDTPINLKTEYGDSAYIDWDASIKTLSSGSKVFVRIYDVTNKIAVNGSELSTNSTTSVRVSSGRLYFWNGSNTYRVQIKSLNGLDAFFDGGRIKIVY